jgi:hypothetical protein
MRRVWLTVLILGSTGAFAEAPQISLQPSSVLLGSGTTVSVAVRLPRAGARLRSAVNTGKLQALDGPSAVEQHFIWTPPSTRSPMTALLVFWIEERGSPPEVSLARIPLVGRTTLEIHTEPTAQVRVQVADASFGPIRADKRGRAEVPIEVPPGIQTVQVIAQAHGRLRTRTSPLDVPRSSRLAMAFSPEPLVRGEPTWLIIAHPDAWEPELLEIDVSGGRLSAPSNAPGHALFQVAPVEKAEELTAKASLRGEKSERAEITARIAPDEVRDLSGGGHFFASVSAGGFYAGGANSGAALAIDGSYSIPAAAGRFALDFELGFRSASLSAPVTGLGSVHSRVSALSIEVALRALFFERGAWAVHGRLGGGVLPFRVSAQSSFQPPFTQSGLASEGFASAQVGYRIRTVELFAELRGGIAPTKTSTLDAQLGGLLFALGARYQLR